MYIHIYIYICIYAHIHMHTHTARGILPSTLTMRVEQETAALKCSEIFFTGFDSWTCAEILRIVSRF